MPGRSCQGAHCLASEAKAAVPETLNVACTHFGPPEAMVSAHSDPSHPHFSQMCFSIRLAHIHHFHTIGQITLLPGSFHLPLIPPTTFARKLPLFQMLCCWWRERKGEGGFIELLLCGGHNLKWLFCKVSQLKWQLPLCVPIGGCGRPREAALLLHLPPTPQKPAGLSVYSHDQTSQFSDGPGPCPTLCNTSLSSFLPVSQALCLSGAPAEPAEEGRN